MRKSYLLIIFLLASVQLKAQAQSSPKWAASKDFCMSDDNVVNIWGGGKRIPGTFFSGYLPAFFERKLDFNTFNLKGSTFQWIFTGNNGG